MDSRLCLSVVGVGLSGGDRRSGGGPALLAPGRGAAAGSGGGNVGRQTACGGSVGALPDNATWRALFLSRIGLCRDEAAGGIPAEVARKPAMRSAVAEGDAGFAEVVRGHFDVYLVTDVNADEVFTHFTGDMSEDFVTI